VKVQHPDMEAVIRSDMRLMKLLTPLLKRTFPLVASTAVLDRAERTLLEECDYRREAAIQQAAARAFAGDPEILVPEVHPAWSTGRVLTMDFVDGASFRDFAQAASVEERDQAGRAIFRFAHEALYRHHILNGDPTPGNYLFLDDGRVAVVDFGFAEMYAPERARYCRDQLAAILADDCEGFRATIQALGYVGDEQRFDVAREFQAARDFWVPAESPDGRFRFSVGRLRTFMRTALLANNRLYVRLPVSDLRLQRMYMLLYGTLGELGAEASWHTVLAPLLAEAPGERLASGES